MARDNSSTDWSSWNIKDDAQKDTQHWDPNAKQDLQQQFGDYNTLRILEQLAEDDPEVFKEIMREQPNNPKAAVQALAKLNQSKGS